MAPTTTHTTSESLPIQDIDPRDVGTPDDWIVRHPELIRLTGRHPFSSEPPLEYLKTFVTPTPLHFVRNHGPVPRLAWESHSIQIDGLVDEPRSFTMQDLTELFAEKIKTLPVLVVCSGNRRKEQNMMKKTIGFSWGAGAASTAEWTGVPLHELLTACGVQRSSAKHVWFEGADVLPHSGYGTCIPAHAALDPSCDVLVAWKMNGETLSPDHGFPVRIIVPGHVGGRMVKWLSRIHVSDIESTNYYHIHDNRLLPSHVDAQIAAAENWWVKPEFAIQELNVNSVLLTPGHGETLPIPTGDDEIYKVSGYAYSGGGRRVIRVEVTIDDGERWLDCRIIYTEKPNDFGKMWCWVQYELELPVRELRQAKEICVRAWDTAMNSQPEFPTWNVMGMMNNPWFRVRIHASSETKSLLFEHPTQAGNLKGGWMTADRIARPEEQKKKKMMARVQDQPEDEPSTSERARPSPCTRLWSSTSHWLKALTGWTRTYEEQRRTAEVEVVEDQDELDESMKKLRVISRDEVAKHNSKESCWFICRDLVYDVTSYLDKHPGGAASILLCAGTDCTDEFESIHSTKAWQLLAPYCIGRCGEGSDASESEDSTDESTEEEEDSLSIEDVALKGAQRVPLVLIEKRVVSHDTRIFRFALPAKHLRLGLPTGNHVLLYGKVRGKSIVRAYTPISADDEQGFVSFLIKIYFAGEDPAHPEGGQFSQYIDGLHLGSRIDMKGPLGHFTYLGEGQCNIDDHRSFHVNKFGFIAGGTGITPIYQIMRAILTTPGDTTQVALIYCVRKEKDLLLREELEQLQKLKPDQCRIYYTLSELDAKDSAEWTQGRTRLTTEMVRAVIGSDACHVALCGPPGLLEQVGLPALALLGYDCAVQTTVL